MSKGLYSVTFVVLHYLVFEETVECVESILQMKHSNLKIVVIDNFSPNGSGDKLKEKYRAFNNITVILNTENVGFTLGNNIGYKYAKHNLRSDFIILANNDVVFRQSCFAEEIITEYIDNKYDILGPDIISMNGMHQNPQMREPLNERQVREIIRENLGHLILNYGHFDRIYLGLKRRAENLIASSSKIKTSDPALQGLIRETNVQLHGSCLVFSPLYVSKYEGLYPKYAFFMEEDILMFLARKEGLKTLYYPFLSVLHKEDCATDAVYGKGIKKRRFQYANMLSSAKTLLALMQGDSALKW